LDQVFPSLLLEDASCPSMTVLWEEKKLQSVVREVALFKLSELLKRFIFPIGA